MLITWDGVPPSDDISVDDDQSDSNRMRRRSAIAGLVAGAVTGCSSRTDTREQAALPERSQSDSVASVHPSVFVPHGGGPWTIVDMGLAGQYATLDAYLRGLLTGLSSPPRAVLCISAHWEAKQPTVMTSAAPPMLYDYGGFPQAAYEFVWPAPGAPDIAAQVKDHLQSAGVAVAEDSTRGFDHGTFIPLMLSDPKAHIPTFQLSLIAGLDPAQHFAIGQALAPLRAQGVLIVGSGMSYHNMRDFQAAFGSATAAKRVADDSRRFDEWLDETMIAEPSVRQRRLIEWAEAPAARIAHPREEHLLPLMVAAGAAAEDVATTPYRGTLLGAHVRAVHLG